MLRVPHAWIVGALVLFLAATVCDVTRGATCGCEPVVDTCGFINGGGITPPPNATTAPEIYCVDCMGTLPDHCGICGGCQLPFFTCNYTVTSEAGGLQSGNRLGSLASLSMDHIACGQYHRPDPQLAPTRASGIWTFTDEPPPSPPCNPIEIKLTNLAGNSRGHASDSSPNFLLIGNWLASPKQAHFFAKTDLPLFSWFFDLQDPCGGNQFGWDVFVDEELGLLGVSDPKSHFSGSTWIFTTVTPDLVQNITVGEKGWRFGHAIDGHNGTLVVGAPRCDMGVPDGGCLYFYLWNGTAYEDVIAFVNSPSPFEDEKLGWRVSTNGNWTAAGTAAGNVVHMYHREPNGTWTFNSTITEPIMSPQNRFGYALHVTPDNLLVIGDERFVASPQARGAVFTYRLQGGRWQLWSSYTDGLGEFNTHFGAAVDANEQYILVGIPGAEPHGKCLLIDRDVTPCFGCDDVYNSCLMFDECGVCGGDNATCLGCDGVPNSGLVFDDCGVCGGFNDTCIFIDPLLYFVDCNDNQFAPLASTTFVITVGPNTTLPVEYTQLTDPFVGDHSFNAATGEFTFTPPLLFTGVVPVDFMVCYAGTNVCNNQTIGIVVNNCTDCLGGGGGLIFDECGVCGGDGSSCAGCDGVPNSGTVVDFCGVCGGTNTTCLNGFVLPIVAGPCNPFKIFLGHEPAANPVVWFIVTPPVYGTATISATQGCISYTPPASLMGLPPADVMTVRVKDGFGNSDDVVVNIPFAIFVIDACGLCGGDNSTCAGCDGVPNSGLVFDRCGVCGGDGSTCPQPRRCDAICIIIQIFLWAVVGFLLFLLLALLRYCTFLRRRQRPPNVVPASPAYTDSFGRTFNLMPGAVEYRPHPPQEGARRLWGPGSAATTNVVTATDNADMF